MRVAYGRSQVGVRAEDRVPKIKSKNVTVMAAMHSRGMLLQSILPGNGNRGFPYKFLPPYSPYFMAIECMFAEWKTYVKRGLANTRALNRAELELRINSFVLSPHHAMNYVSHAGRNILQYTRGVRIFDN